MWLRFVLPFTPSAFVTRVNVHHNRVYHTHRWYPQSTIKPSAVSFGSTEYCYTVITYEILFWCPLLGKRECTCRWGRSGQLCAASSIRRCAGFARDIQLRYAQIYQHEIARRHTPWRISSWPQIFPFGKAANGLLTKSKRCTEDPQRYRALGCHKSPCFYSFSAAPFTVEGLIQARELHVFVPQVLELLLGETIVAQISKITCVVNS